jgi:hypothetical protein
MSLRATMWPRSSLSLTAALGRFPVSRMALASSASEMPTVVSLAPSRRKAYRANSCHVFRQSDPIAEQLPELITSAPQQFRQVSGGFLACLLSGRHACS